MLKVKEWLQTNGLLYHSAFPRTTMVALNTALEETKTNVITICLKNNHSFLCEKQEIDFEKELITIYHVFDGGMNYKEKVIIRTSEIAYISV